MNRSSIIFLQTLIVLIGIAAICFLILEPQFEGRNVHATFFEIYFQDPFLAYAYIGSIPFFIALFQAFKILRNCGRNNVFSQMNVKAFRIIKFCAIAIIGFAVGGEIYIIFGMSDDRAGGISMGLLIIFGSIVVATAAAIFEKVLQKAVDIKSENDFTV